MDDVTLHIERVDGEGWSASDVVVDLGLPEKNAPGPRTRGQAERARTFANTHRCSNRTVRALDLGSDIIKCPKARVPADWPALGRQAIDANVELRTRGRAHST